ncbi:MAG: hypothetical protein H6R00_4414 [Proteobacteria bacterium]|nr:hypothetical protein [Pseudomonadota bacterium]
MSAFGTQYLPAPTYMEDSRYYAMASAVFCLLAGFSLVANMPFDETKDSGAGRLLSLIVSILIFGIAGHQLVTTKIPMAAALLSGKIVDINYTVESPDYIKTKFFNSPISLADMPTYNNVLCDLPAEFRQQLHPGSEIVVTGRGTSWGLFVRSARVR